MAESIIRIRCPIWAALLLVAAAAPTLWAQATVSLDVNADEGYVNEALLVTIRVENFRTCDPPTIPEIASASAGPLQGPMESSQTTIINGRTSVSRSRSYAFEVTPLAAGELVIPAIQVSVDGRTLQTKPLRLPVRASDAGELLSVEISCERQRIYVGQRVPLTLTIWVKPIRTQGGLLNQREMMGFLQAVDFGPFPTRNIRMETRTLASSDGAPELFYTYSVMADFVPDRPGLLNFDQIEVGLRYPKRVYRNIFGQIEAEGGRNLRASPKVIDVAVLPVPTEGRPANFTGAVGTFDLIVTAKPTSVRVGDPIQLTLDIRGDGPIETLPPPNFAADPPLTQAFRVPSVDLSGEANESRKRFTVTIRALRSDVSEIPPLAYPYFDPDRELFVIAKSDAIPITVAPAAQLETGSLVEASGPQAEQNTRELRPLDGLRGNETSETVLLRNASPISAGRLAAVMGAPPAAFAIAWGCVAYSQTRSPGRRRRQTALGNARRRIDQARRLPQRESAAEIASALAAYLADRLDEQAAHFVGRVAVEFLQSRNVDRPTVDRWSDVLTRCEQVSFGGMADDDSAALGRDAQECLRAVERERL